MKRSGRRRWLSCIVFASLLVPVTVTAQLGPQTVVRTFCEADATGARGTVQGWSRIAALVEWPLEPAWDQAVLVNSYTVGSPQPTEDDQFTVEVRYLVTARVKVERVDETPEVESVVFRVHAEGTSWHIVGPPPPPHIFAQNVDAKAMQASFEKGGLNFLPNSLFVWQMFQSADWKVVRRSTADLLDGSAYREVKEANTGDLVVYLRDGVPYHVGLLEAEGQVVSSTLNAGIMRSSGNAFPGEVRFLRLIQPDTDPTPSERGTPPADEGAAAANPAMRSPTPSKPTAKATSLVARTPTVSRKKRSRTIPSKQPRRTTTPAR